MEMTPARPASRQMIERYGTSGFRVSGVEFPRPIIVLPGRTVAWALTGFENLTIESLAPVLEEAGIEVFIIGCGQRMQLVPKDIRQTLRAAGIVTESMDTGAACRTFNVLMMEERRAAAALIPVVIR